MKLNTYFLYVLVILMNVNLNCISQNSGEQIIRIANVKSEQINILVKNSFVYGLVDQYARLK